MHDNSISERGTSRALAEYAALLEDNGHEVVVCFRARSKDNHPAMIRELQERFETRPYDDLSQLNELGRGFDVSYMIKSGQRDGVAFPQTREIVHAVFQDYDPHGSRYVYVSEWLANAQRKRVLSARGLLDGSWIRGGLARRRGCLDALRFGHLPHICEMPAPDGDFRAELGIPDEAFVIVRHGGYTTFDLPWVKDVVEKFVTANNSVHFVGMNTEPFMAHPRAHFVRASIDRQRVSNFLATGNVFLHGRRGGESFGMAIVEALQVGIPSLSWGLGIDRNHVTLLGDLGGLYGDPDDLARRLNTLIKGTDVSEQQRSARMARGSEFRRWQVWPKLQVLIET